MFVKITTSGPRQYVKLVESYRDTSGVPRQRVIATLGRIEAVRSGEADSLQLSRAAYAEKMLVVPSALYSPRGRYRNCIRLSCCYPWSDAYERGLHRLAELSASLLP